MTDDTMPTDGPGEQASAGARPPYNAREAFATLGVGSPTRAESARRGLAALAQQLADAYDDDSRESYDDALQRAYGIGTDGDVFDRRAIAAALSGAELAARAATARTAAMLSDNEETGREDDDG